MAAFVTATNMTVTASVIEASTVNTRYLGWLQENNSSCNGYTVTDLAKVITAFSSIIAAYTHYFPLV